MKRNRLDILCVERGLCQSRQRAQAMILAGQVLVSGQPVTKAGTQIPLDAVIELCAQDHPYVSRGGLKLEAALNYFQLDVTQKVALDIGASTGGFCDCLLQHGARHVIAVDVGYGQLAWKLRRDPRITCIERVNARYLEQKTLLEKFEDKECWPPDLATIDVSFISLTLILPKVTSILGPTKPILALVKPQFEAGKEDVGKGGVVKDPQIRNKTINKIIDWANNAGYTVVGGVDSPVHGPSGNIEHLLLLLTPAVVED